MADVPQDLREGGTSAPIVSMARALSKRGSQGGVFSWQFLRDDLARDPKCTILGESSRHWIAWKRNATTGIAVIRSVADGVRVFYIENDEPIDLRAMQCWLQSLAPTELIYATAALEVAVNG